MVKLSPSQAYALIDRIRDEAPPELACLPTHANYTPRQREVVQLAHSGMSYSEISACLGISANTVKSHLQAARAVCTGVRYGRARV